MRGPVLEKKVQDACVGRLKTAGAYVYRAMGNAMTGKGTPDILCCIDGQFVAIEFKREHDGAYGVTDPQRIRMRQIRKAGGKTYVVADVHEIDKLLAGTLDEYTD